MRKSKKLFVIGGLSACAAAVLFAPKLGNTVVRAGVESDGSVKINEQNFPDANFREKVRAFDKDGNGVLSSSERSIRNITFRDSDIESIAGVEYFPNLENLDVDGNKITSVNLSANTKLDFLNVASNQITSIDLSKNVNLRWFTINYNPIQKLDLTKNTYLTHVSCLGRSATLTSLNISGLQYLYDLECRDQKLTKLDVSSCPKLQWFDCSNNNLSALNVSSNPNLTRLFCQRNSITALDVSKNTALQELDCSENQLSALNVSKCTTLVDLSCSSNKITSLDVSQNTALVKLYCYKNQLTTLKGCNSALTTLYCYENQLSSLDVSKCTSLTKLYCYDNKISSLNVSKNSALEQLDCSGNQITTIDVSSNKALTGLSCGKVSSDQEGAQISSLNVKGATALDHLTCGYSAIKTLDLSTNTELIYLDISGTQSLSTLDLTNQKKLETIYARGVKLKTLNASNKTKLKKVSLWETEITTVNLSGCTGLTQIADDLYDSTFSTFNLSGATSLKEFSSTRCTFNTVNVSGATSLTKLEVENDGVTSLNVSGTTALKTLKCRWNGLTSLDVSTCSSLETLECNSNKLTSLKLGGAANLVELNCSDNELKSLDVTKNTKLKKLSCDQNPIASLNLNSTPLLNACMSHRVSVTYGYMYKLSSDQYVIVDRRTNVIASNLTPTPTPTNTPTPSPTPKVLAAIDETHFPDAAFRSYVLKYHDKNADKVLSENEVSEVTSLTVYSDPQIKSIKGVEYFTEVQKLNCASSGITALDISKLTKLEELNCISNQIKSLDCSKNTKLKKLYISDNDMTSLNIQGLSSLEILICKTNSLSTINLNGCTKLLNLVKTEPREATGTHVYYPDKPVYPSYTYGGNSKGELTYDRFTDIVSSSLTPTPVPPAPASDSVAVNSTNFPDAALREYFRVADLDENRNGALEKSEIAKITELEVQSRGIKSLKGMEYFENLTLLYCQNNQLTSLDLTKLTKLQSLDCSGNQIKSVNLYFCPTLAQTFTEGTREEYDDGKYILYWRELSYDDYSVLYVDLTTNVTVTKPSVGKPSDVKVELASTTSVKVSWSAVSGATGYQVWRSTSATSDFKAVGSVTTTNRVCTGLTAGTTYYFKVRAYKEVNGTKYYGAYSSVVSATPLAVPAGVKAASASATSVKVSWNAASGVTGYQVWRGTSATGSFTAVGSVTTTSRTCTGLTTGTTYYFKVRAYKEVNGTKYYGAFSSVANAVPKVAAPSGVKAKTVSTTSIEVSWNEVSGATGYQVCRATSATGTFTAVGSVTTTSRVCPGLSAGTTYYFKVRAYKEVNGTRYYGNYSSVISGVTKPAAPGNAKAAVASATKVNVSWSAVTGATGYEVRRSESASGTFTKLGTVTTTNRACPGLTTGKTYYFKVRAYIEVNGEKIYGAYSTVVSATPKA